MLRNDERIKHLLEEVRLLSETIADKNELLKDKSRIIQLLEKSCDSGANGGSRSLLVEGCSKTVRAGGASVSKKTTITRKAVSAAVENAVAVSTVQQMIHMSDQTVNGQNGSSVGQKDEGVTVKNILPNQEASEDDAEGFKLVNGSRKRNRPSHSTSSGPQQSKRPTVNRSRRSQSGAVGTGSARDNVRVAPKKSFIYVSRFAPDTPAENVKGIIQDVCPEVECETVRSGRPEYYSSFKLTVNAGNREVAMNPEKWPAGIFINRFFPAGRRGGSGEPSGIK